MCENLDPFTSNSPFECVCKPGQGDKKLWGWLWNYRIYFVRSLSSSNRTFWKQMPINGLRCIWPVFEWWNMLPESIRGNNLFLPGRGLDRIESYGMTHTVWLFDRWAVIRETILESGLETTVISLKKIHHCNQFLGCFLLLLLHCLRFSSLVLFC